MFGLLGPNGAGKTSALSAIEGLLRPDAEAITIGVIDARAHPRQARAQLGVHLQSTSFQSNLSLLQILRLYAGLFGVELSVKQITDRVAEVHLKAEASKRIRELSGGQQQRLSLLIATIHDPPLVLLDEPTAGLDP
ncbi:MAG: ATP-binding cassette domain-containing protein [Candidatus Dormibacteria bacterium]